MWNKKLSCRIFVLIAISIVPSLGSLTQNGNNVVAVVSKVTVEYKSKCGPLVFRLFTCTKTKEVRETTYKCKDGFKQRYDTDPGCDYAICDGKTDYQGACNIYYSNDGQYPRKTKHWQRSSGGTCVDKNKCNNCNDGYYGDGGYCRICTKISHCNHRRCTTGSDQTCLYCEGDVGERKYWRAYTPAADGGKSCQKACSWRSDSTRCFPGTCANEQAANCQCKANFGGTHCEKILNTPDIQQNHAVFYNLDKTNKVENDPNHYEDNKPIIWTNFVGVKKVETKMSANYTQPKMNITDHYVDSYRIGLVEQTFTLSFQGSKFCSQKKYFCPGMSPDQPKDSNMCTYTFNIEDWPAPLHDDKIIFKVEAKNGGYLNVANREENQTINTYYYQGSTMSREFEYHWDLDYPVHCSAAQGGSCDPFISVTKDITNNGDLTMVWGGWTDALSGLSHFQYQIFDLDHDGSALKESRNLVHQQTGLGMGETTATFSLSEPGMYSIHFSAFDNAGNYQTGRGLLLFDDQSVVDVVGGKRTFCSSASENTSNVWVIKDINNVKISWTGRFINSRHVNNRWLNTVMTYAPSPNISIYEDLYGKRTNKPINNKNGIVDFKVSYRVHGPTEKKSRVLTSVSNIHNQFDILPLNWLDGDRLKTTVRALDVLGVYKDEEITVYKDASPPIIENLWLTREDRFNINVHRIEDFQLMTIEWVAYDDHSGLDSVYWKLYDKYDGTVVLHGHEDIVAQGNAADINTCKNKYGSYARGQNCYCTNFVGCYHRHFQVKPAIKANSGLILGKDSGVHDHDYHIDVSVTNKALITTVLTKKACNILEDSNLNFNLRHFPVHIFKITIDVSAPHAGIVSEGLPGQPEVDYQQEKEIKAYWDQFFDRESGVFFYQYMVGTSCAAKSNFDLKSSHPNRVETYNTYASYTAPTEGTYYFTVVAFNRALEPSEPVCSDGVTIDTSAPGVKEVFVNDAVITGGLITNAAKSKYYILATDRTRREISGPTSECVAKATQLTDIDNYLLKRLKNGSVVQVDGDVFCRNSTGAPSSIGVTLSKSSMMELSWKPIDIPAKVYDYEVGFSSTAGSTAPDLMSFQSTKQHSNFRVLHGNIPEATRFFIIIKTTSKSNVEGITSIGPCFIDTTPPDFAGEISVAFSEKYLIATWPTNAFSDSEELFDMVYEYSIGHDGTDIQEYKPLQGGGSCTLSKPPMCTAINIDKLDWYLHGHHTYYVNIKVTNTARLITIQASTPYIHDVQLAVEGIVLDIDTQNYITDIPGKDIEDIDFQIDTTSMAARWSGFFHPHLDITYMISVGTTKEGEDIVSLKDVGMNLSHHETGLSLTPFEKYYFTVTAVTAAGNVVVSSDGVTIVTENFELPGVKLYDGQPCTMTEIAIKHHEEDHRLYCAEDIDVQASLNSIKAYWTVPENMQHYTSDAFIGIEERSQEGSKFNISGLFTRVFDISINDLYLNPGFKYRVVLKLCARTICFKTIRSDGVMVMSTPPVTGEISVKHLNISEGGGTEKLAVTFDQFYDPDIENEAEKYEAVNKYEYAITDDSVQGKMHMSWKSLSSFSPTNNKISFEVVLTGEMDFSKCKRFSIRGYNRAKLTSIVSTEIKLCKAYNPIMIIPNIVIDAVGEPDVLDGIGKRIYLEKNAYWPEPDKDYTPYKNLISAAWPTLRHRSYTYAVLNARLIDVTTYYRQTSQLTLRDPCSHPDALKCGTTEHEFANIEFEDGELEHGVRYTVCVHADSRKIVYEHWTDILPEINSCSDGIIVDLTSPVAGNVWIGSIPTITHQTVNSDMYVNWDGFHDVEEYNNGPHSTGIKEYIIGVGTTAGGNDVYSWENVGVVQHKAIHNLYLQNGYKYYATVKAYDFGNRETIVTSNVIILDTTPPDKSNHPITTSNRHITSKTEIEACWKNVFSDIESGIDYYLWSIGSEPGYTDIMTYLKVSNEDECGSSNKNNPLDLLEGHYYYINVRAFNKAGLSTLATSWAYQVDTTPPIKGHVYDGGIALSKEKVKDWDYQIETEFISAHWEGFHDAHSTIEEYYISVGTCPQCADVLSAQAIGITQEYTLMDTHLGSGLTYYTTITACNTALLCTSVTSDGIIIDNSPPTKGVVRDGTGLYDTAYQSIPNFISAKWYGFTDPQSGLQKYVWRAGTTQGGDDVFPDRELHLTEVAALYNTSLSFPVNTRIYVTVRAYNKVGLSTEASSNGFIVDTSPPVFSKPVTFSEDFGINGLKQSSRSAMKVKWSISDPQSFIKRQFLSISSHVGGEFNLSSVKINGIARSHVLTGLQLHDGVTYYVTLISCNGAEICVHSTSKGMLVDSTPPSRGMFAINTDHSANPDLARHSNRWMMWASNAVYLAWLGFSDVHTGVVYYHVTVGSRYMDSDLCKEPDKKYFHTTTNTDHGDEGKVQLFTIDTKKLTSYNTLYISIWAYNGVGLRSHIIHSAFKRVGGGALDLIRRCDAMSCEGHCVCAPQDQRCTLSPLLQSCIDVSSSNPNSLLLVKDTNGYSTDDQDITSSSNMLRAAWIISQIQGNQPMWYEWSVGYKAFATPSGVYDQVNEKVWQDNGKMMDAVFTMATGKSLVDGQDYTFFVQVWYTPRTYAIFRTDGITVTSQAPAVASVRGKIIAEKTQGKLVKDEDYLLIGRPLTLDWKGKFLRAESIVRFEVYISTYPGGHDIFEGTEEIPGTATNVNLTVGRLMPGVKHYSNVVAINNAGLQTTATSDGFMVDHLHPVAGIVYDGLGMLDLEYQNVSNVVAAHWHGFIDTESGIKKYTWCVGNTTHPTECSLINWINAGLHVSISKNLSADIPQGSKIYSKVFATDNVGLASQTIVSDGVLIDTTPPVAEKFVHGEDNLVMNPSFENTRGSLLNWEDINSTDICTVQDTYKPLSWEPELSSCLAVVTSTFNFAKDESSFLFIKGGVEQQLNDIKKGMLYKVQFYSSHLPIWDSVAANKEGFMSFGSQKKIFLIYTKAYRKDGHGGSSREVTSWHRHTYYLRATEDKLNLTIGSVDVRTGIFIDGVSVVHVNMKSGVATGHVTGHIVYLHKWGSIHGSWNFMDPESPIIDYTWAIGFAEGGEQIQSFRSEGLMNFGFNNNVTLIHNTFIYMTCKATNAAGLISVSYSDPILVDLTPPDIKFVNDGRGVDEDSWLINEVSANWEVDDKESGIHTCKWAVGYAPGQGNLMPFTVVDVTTIYKDFDYSVLEGHTIYSTLFCENGAGLTTTKSTDGVKISEKRPSIENAVLEIISGRATEYSPLYGFQGVTDSVRLKWSGFTDYIGIDTYLVNLDNSQYDSMFFPKEQEVGFLHYSKMSLKGNSRHSIALKAVNEVYLKSDAVYQNLTVHLGIPQIVGTKKLSIAWNVDKFTVSWAGVFTSVFQLYYEVSAGTYSEGVNVLQQQYTNQTSVMFGLPMAVVGSSGLKIYMFVRAVSVVGFYAQLKGEFELP